MSDSSFELAVLRARATALYEAIKQRIAESEDIGECKAIEDKAKGMIWCASILKDKTLLNFAKRVRALAVRRYGELLANIPLNLTMEEIENGK